MKYRIFISTLYIKEVEFAKLPKKIFMGTTSALATVDAIVIRKGLGCAKCDRKLFRLIPLYNAFFLFIYSLYFFIRMASTTPSFVAYKQA